VIVIPAIPDIAFVAALGHAYGPNDERAFSGTLNGGKTGRKFFLKDNHTGAIDIFHGPAQSQRAVRGSVPVQRTP